MDTIYALSTAPGKAGVAVIRVSGPDAALSAAHFGAALPAHRRAALRALRMPDGSMLDQALMLYFEAPHSFTGENIIEYQVHGGRSILRSMLAQLGSIAGYRMADKGEFTRRAFLNGKMDLTGVEGLADLIDADTEVQRKQALRSMEGQSGLFFGRLRESILHALAFLEAYIDFPDEEIPPEVLSQIHHEVQIVTAQIEAQLAGGRINEQIREGVRVAIIGPPNAGKSSLLNCLAGREAAIVSHLAGTTRDVIEVQLDIGGYPVILSDTAGIRDHKDEIEAEGIKRSLLLAGEADINILLFEKGISLEGSLMRGLVDERTILAVNKCDTPDGQLDAMFKGQRIFPLSVKHQQGLEALLQELVIRIEGNLPSEWSYVTRQRHRDHLEAAREHLRAMTRESALALELQCEELRRAATEIGKITGKISVDELLGHIFASFCIGK